MGQQSGFIYVVDDNIDTAALLVDLLLISNYRSKVFNNGQMVLNSLQTVPIEELPDLILLDLMMPGMNGMEVLRHIKANTRLPFIPVIFVTAHAETQTRIAGLEIGADDYLTKPINRSELLARVNSLLRLKQAYDEKSRLLSEVKTAYDRLSETQQELAEAEKKKGQMEAMVSTAAAICHEMSQPMTSALITLQLMRQSEPDELSDDDFDTMESSLLQARTILYKLRALTRYETKSYLGEEDILDLDSSSCDEANKMGIPTFRDYSEDMPF